MMNFTRVGSARLQIKLLIAVSMSILVFLSYRGVTENGFILYDDPGYVTENRHVQEGLTAAGLMWAFTTSHTSNWHPLTWVSLMLDRELFGMNARGYHRTNVLLHWIGGILLFFALSRLTGRLLRSGLVAGLFLVHPLHVESVAWVAERKDVLSGLFWMLGMWGYARYVEKPDIGRYGWIVLFFALGLMAKPMVVTFPFVLLLLDYWPLGRLSVGNKMPARLLYEKMPLFLLSILSSIVTFLVQKGGGAVVSMEKLPLVDRLINAAVAYAEYLFKMLLPGGLSFFYPYQGPLSHGHLSRSFMILGTVSVLAVFCARRRPYITAGWLWYLGTLVPVIGFVQVGSQAMADRYTYLPLIGIFIMAVWGLSDLFMKFRLPRSIQGIVWGAILIGLAMMTQVQVGYWKNSVTLFTQAIRNTERNFQAHCLLAQALVENRDLDQSMYHYREALRIRPSFPEARNGLGHLLMVQGEYGEAVEQFEKALRDRPRYAPAIKNLGDLRMRQGRSDEAIVLYQRAFQYEKSDPELYNNYGVALFGKGDVEVAVLQIREALRLKPDYVEARNNLRKILDLHKEPPRGTDGGDGPHEGGKD